MKIAILGAGAMGTALTVPCSERNEVALWGTEYDREILKNLEKGGEHPRIGAALPENTRIYYPEELENAVEGSEVVILAVSAGGVVPVMKSVSRILSGSEILATVAKGLVEQEGEIKTPAELIASVCKNPVVAITGPSIARELAHRSYTKAVFSSFQASAAEKMKLAMETGYYRIEVSGDIIGCELSAAFKNIYSIALAWPDGLEEKNGRKMNNLRGILMTQALREMCEIVERFGGMGETVYGLSGVGDMICTAGGGRNGMFGKLLAKGKSAEEALEEMKRMGVGVVEGYSALPLARKMLGNLAGELPLFAAVHGVVFENKRVEDVLTEIL